MKLFKYSLLVCLSLTYFSTQSFSISTQLPNIVGLQQKASQNDIQAQITLGDMYEIGKGVPRDYKKALEWYTKAANQGNAQAQLNLGIIYRDGIGVPKDDKKAKTYFRQSCLNKLQMSCDL